MLTDPTLADQLLWIVDLFCKTMAPEACKRRIGLYGVAVWTRVRRFERRFCALHAMWKAGTLPRARVRAAATPHPTPPSQGDSQGGREPGPPGVAGARAAAAAFDSGAYDAASGLRACQRLASVLPRTLAWLYKMLPMSAGTLAHGVGSLITNYPEMKEFAAACPQVRRMLRPICKMVGLKLPEYLALPKRVRVRKKDASLSEADDEELLTARFPDTPAAIGYGGRSFPPLPNDYVPPKDWG